MRGLKKCLNNNIIHNIYKAYSYIYNMSNFSKMVWLTLPDTLMDKFNKEDNKAGLIRILLEKYYDNSKLMKLPKEKLMELKALDDQRKEIEAKIEQEINNA